MSRSTVLARSLTAAAVLTAAVSFGLQSSPAFGLLGPSTPHLAVVVMENKEYTQIVGNVNAPYINNTLVPQGRLFTHYFATMHPSLPNYLVLTSGRFGTCLNDFCPTAADPSENLFHQMNVASTPITWKTYAETMPSNCYPSDSGAYVAKHNPAVYYANISAPGDGTCSLFDVPYTQLATDLQTGNLPQFSFIVPNVYNDMHSTQNVPPCQLSTSLASRVCQGDTWLRANVPPLLSDGGRNDVTVLLVFDEGSSGNGGGGRIVLLEIGPNTCTHCTEQGAYTHYGLLRAIERWFGLPELGQSAPSL